MKNKTVIKCYTEEELFEVCIHLNIVPKHGLFHFESDVIGVRVPDNKIANWCLIWDKGMNLTTAQDYLKKSSCLH
jgi:hypothetical protein